MHLILADLQKIHAIIQDLATLNDGVPGEDAKDSFTCNGLSGTRLAYDCKRSALFQIEGDVTHCAQDPGICPK